MVYIKHACMVEYKCIFFLSARVTSEKFCYLLKSNQGPELHYAHLSEDVKFNCIDSFQVLLLLLLDITDKGLIVLISDHNVVFFLYNFRPVQNYFSSYETDKSVTRGGGGENPEKTTWHTHKQNLVCVTCDCKTDEFGSNLRRSVHCLGDGCCQSDIAFFNYPI